MFCQRLWLVSDDSPVVVLTYCGVPYCGTKGIMVSVVVPHGVEVELCSVEVILCDLPPIMLYPPEGKLLWCFW
ncbi:hypothetical protein Taro_033767, partial [Colocasia esculenta]|nr:hypothetical protein [Colocasia esculenta]